MNAIPARMPAGIREGRFFFALTSHRGGGPGVLRGGLTASGVLGEELSSWLLHDDELMQRSRDSFCFVNSTSVELAFSFCVLAVLAVLVDVAKLRAKCSSLFLFPFVHLIRRGYYYQEFR